jgi:rare lipoprotein A
MRVLLKREAILRPSLLTAAFAVTLLIASPAQVQSRGFAWFFSHSKPSESCVGHSVVATYYTSGRRTASGEAFVSSGYTAAHRTLPFGSQVRVTNPDNGRSVTVTINDRGPFTRGVTLDLARGAAHAIGMSGTQWICMDQ